MANQELKEQIIDNFSPECVAKVISELQTSRDSEVECFKNVLLEIVGGYKGYNILIDKIEG